jgi:hypothetical protein
MVVAEGLLLALYRRVTGRGVPILCLGVNLVAGACLLLAARLALGGATPAWIAVALGAALMAHVADLYFRWE